MRGLLSISFQRKLTLIDFLYSSPYKNLKDIQKLLTYNLTTFSKDIHEINSMIHPCEILKSSNAEYFIFFPNNTNIEYIYSAFLKESLEFKLLKLLIYSDYPSIDVLTEQLYVSPSTLKRTILRMNTLLNKTYGFKIKTSPVMLIGDESKIINFIIAFCKEYYISSQNMLSDNQSLFLKKMFEEVTHNKAELTQVDLDKFNFYIYAVILRFRQCPPDKPLLNSVLHYNFSDYDDYFEKLFNVTPDESLYATIESLLFNSDYLLSYQELVLLSKTRTSVQQKKQKLDNLLAYLSDELNIENANYEELILYLYNYISFDYGEDYILFPKYNYFLNSLTHHFPYFYNLISSMVEEITSYTVIDKSYEFIYHLVIRWEELQIALKTLHPKMNIGIYYFSDYQHNQFMKRFLEEYFDETISVTILFDLNHSFVLTNDHSYDLVITNMPLMTGENLDRIICSSLFPTANQLEMISDYYIKWSNSYYQTKKTL